MDKIERLEFGAHLKRKQIDLQTHLSNLKQQKEDEEISRKFDQATASGTDKLNFKATASTATGQTDTGTKPTGKGGNENKSEGHS